VENYASLSYTLAKLYAGIDSFDIATSIMTDVVETRKKYLEEGDVRYIESLCNLAEYYSLSNHYQEAIDIGEEAVRCIRVMKGDTIPSLMIGLHNLARYYADFGNYDRARILMSEAVELQKKEEEHSLRYLESLSLLAEYCGKSIDIEDALIEGMKILRTIQMTDKKSDECYKCLNNLSCIYEKTDSFNIAISLIEEYLNHHVTDSDTLDIDYLLAKIRLAKDYSAISQYNKAATIQEDVVTALRKNEEERKSYALSLSTLSCYYNNTRQKHKALPVAEESIKVFTPFVKDNLYDYATVFLRNLAACYTSNGDYDTSLNIYKKAALILDSLVGKNSLEYAETLNLMAISYEKKDSIEIAITIMKDITEKWNRLINDSSIKYNNRDVFRYYCRWLNSLAEFYNDYNQYTEAILIGEKIQALCASANYHIANSEQSAFLNNLARYYSNLLDYSKAIKICKEAIRLEEIATGKGSPEYLKRLSNLATFYSNSGMDSLAISTLQMVIQEGVKIWEDNNHSYLWALHNLAGAYGKVDRRKAINIYKEVINIYDNQLESNSYSYAQALENIAYFYGIDRYYEEAISYNEMALKVFSLLLGNDNIKLANSYRVMSEYYSKIRDYNKALVYIQKANEIAKKYVNSKGESLGSKWESLYLHQIIPFLTSWYAKVAINNATSTVLSDLFNSILLSKRISLYRRVEGFSWDKIRDNLNVEDIAIEIICVSSFEIDANDKSESIYALVLKKDYQAPKLIKLFDSYFNVEIMAQGELFWRPLMNELNDIKNIYLSPSGYLSYSYPIENLPIGTLNSITDKYNFYRVSSTEEILKKKSRKDYKKAIIYGGLTYDNNAECSDCPDGSRSSFDPLFNTKSEAANISTTLQKEGINCTFYSEDEGTEESFKQLENQNIDIIHIATHGRYIDSSDMDKEIKGNNFLFIKQEENYMPLYEDKALTRSFLVMSGGNALIKRDSTISSTSNDGILTALEISQMNLIDVDLVVLSACESGLGEYGADNGITGFQRGFKKAGVNTLLMSLDKVDDEATRILMVEFYKNLMAGKSKHQSLKDAQHYLRQVENGKYDNPKYWASFIMLDGLN